jgi:dTDP-4-amino-4,6-dideoxygalactose transaminase
MMRIPVAAPQIGPAELDAVHAVLASGALTQGRQVASFEHEFSRLVADRHCVAVSSGTSALHLGLVALGIGPGDEVVVPSFTFAATANAVRLAGATPVFADIEPDTYCLDPSAVEAAVTHRTAAVMPVHLFGHPADMPAIQRVADRHQLAVVEDACQAHAATLDGVPAGAMGHLAAFSFYPTKNMTTGEGGMIVCADETVARTARLLRNQGMEQRYANEIVGHNARMTDVAAAMGRVQLGRLESFTAARRANAAAYDALLKTVERPESAPGARHVFHQYTIRTADRDRLACALQVAGIGSGVYYPTPVHRLPAYDQALELPVTDTVAHEVLSLPVHPGVSVADVTDVARVVDGTTRVLERAS